MVNSNPTFVEHLNGQSVVKAIYRSAVGVDVHAELLVCCFQRYDPIFAQATTETAEFGTTCSQLQQFTSWFFDRQPEVVLMESTGVLWRSPYEALERVGFTNRELALVNARDVKAVSGRKTDQQDAGRLAEYARFGQFKKSFVPDQIFRDMRNVSRQYIRQRNNYAQEKNRFKKTLTSIGCRARSVFSDINGKAAKIILKSFIDGTPDLMAVIVENCGRLRASAEEIYDALNFSVSQSMLSLLRIQRQNVNDRERLCQRTFQVLREMQQPYEAQIGLLMTIPGVKETAARLLLAEFSDDMSAFPTSEHFCSWLGICPGNNKSAGKSYGAMTPKGNKWARTVLTEVGQAIQLSRNNPLKDRFQVFKERRGNKRAIVAIGHKIARMIYCMLKTGEPYREIKTDSLRNHRLIKVTRDLEQAKKEGQIVVTSCGVVDTVTGEVLFSAGPIPD